MTGDLRRPINGTLITCPAGWQATVVAETGSTNADLLAAAAGTPSRTVLVAETQNSARGRLDRAWASPPGAGLTFSVLIRPAAPLGSWAWLPLLTGVALVHAVSRISGTTTTVHAAMKWPNDLLLAHEKGTDAGKAAGILLGATGDAVVIGVGVNVSTRADELPVPTATSLQLCGVPVTGREQLLSEFLASFEELFSAWDCAGGDAGTSGLAAQYRVACDTLGRPVRVELTAGRAFTGVAEDIDSSGHLLVSAQDIPDTVSLDGQGRAVVAAGDVFHLRPA